MDEGKNGLFWADQVADRIINREKYHYLDKKIPKFGVYVCRSAASLSGVMHIGRLSDVIRHISVHRALLDKGAKSKVMWVADDMDPLRKIPQGVPESYEKYLGAPVNRIPDFEKCHDSYADHYIAEYLEVVHEYAFEDLETCRTSDYYKKGSFNPYIRKILANAEKIREIQNKHRTNSLKKEWSPWRAVCGNCGKIITPQTKITEDGKIVYKCVDYNFETTTAKGCGHKGETDPLKDEGKLIYKSEWAAQWAFWKVSCEGAGKEYNVPNSAYWINQEICEAVLDFPAPEYFFYEHLFVDGVKMSASLGNVIYPKQWLEVATPQLLRFFYNKRLMMARSFSWKELPQLYDEYDDAASVYAGKKTLDNEKESSHVKRMYEISNRKGSPEKPLELSFSHASMLAQTFNDEQSITASLKKTGQYSKAAEKQLLERVAKAAEWVRRYAPEEYKFEVRDEISDAERKRLSPQQKKALREFAAILKSRDWKENELFNAIYELCKKNDVKPKEFFQAAYIVLLGKEQGPRLAPFILTLGERAVKLFESA